MTWSALLVGLWLANVVALYLVAKAGVDLAVTRALIKALGG